MHCGGWRARESTEAREARFNLVVLDLVDSAAQV